MICHGTRKSVTDYIITKTDGYTVSWRDYDQKVMIVANVKYEFSKYGFRFRVHFDIRNVFSSFVLFFA